MGALIYNLKKLNHPDPKQRAELLDMSFVSLDKNSIRAQVEVVRLLKPALKRHVYHTSLNFSKKEPGKLDSEKLLAIARDYLNGMGFTDNQYLIFRHHDADHPHLHLLVNRITFDGKVVSDSNNYKKSESLLRKLEQQYNLVAVEHSNHVAMQQNSYIAKQQSSYEAVEPGSSVDKEKHSHMAKDQSGYVDKDQDSRVAIELYSKAPLRSPTKNEVEMVTRTGRPSDKMVLQYTLNRLLAEKNITMQAFITKCEQQGIYLLFNQASTGRVSGITYFYGDFKVTGKALGNSFKWSELVGRLDYEQDRDGQAVSQASERTRAIYDGTEAGVADAQRGLAGNARDAALYSAKFQQSTGTDETHIGAAAQTGGPAGHSRAANGEINHEPAAGAVVDQNAGRYGDWRDYAGGYSPGIEISDDIDDEAILGRNRRRQKQARTNRR